MATEEEVLLTIAVLTTMYLLCICYGSTFHGSAHAGSASVHRLWQAAMEEEAKEAAAVDPEAGAAITRLDELWGIMARDEE